MWLFLVLALADVVIGGRNTLLAVLGSTVTVPWRWSPQHNYTVGSQPAPKTLASGPYSSVQEPFQVLRWRRQETAEERIVGGYTIDIRESPSYTSIIVKEVSGSDSLCGGNLLTERHVLTAAHCMAILHSDDEHFGVVAPSRVMVRVGSTYVVKGGHEHEVRKVCIHPHYLEDAPVESYKDMAVLTLRKAVYLDAMAQTASLYPPLTVEETEYLGGNKCTVAGWGFTSQDGHPSNHLRQVEITLLAMNICEKFYMLKFDSQVHICAMNEGKDSCQGDSGGGVFLHGSIIAITSWGWGCAAGSPGVYARVDNAHEFIENAIHGAPSLASLVPLTLAVSYTVSLL